MAVVPRGVGRLATSVECDWMFVDICGVHKLLKCQTVEIEMKITALVVSILTDSAAVAKLFVKIEKRRGILSTYKTYKG